jgi:ParB-like chromosome segregation protein Spo0J
MERARALPELVPPAPTNCTLEVSRMAATPIPELHSVCEIFPDLDPEPFAELVEDIRAHGLNEPVTLNSNGKLIDGKNRWRACMEAGVEPRTEVHHGDPLAFAVSKNERRRHLSEEQRRAVRAKLAEIAAERAALPQGGDRRSEDFKSEAAPLIAEAAKALGVTVDDVKSVRAVQEHGTPEEQADVMSGKASLRRTADQARMRASGKPHKTPKQSEDYRVDVWKDLVKHCSDGQWHTVEKAAMRIGRAPKSVEETLTAHREADRDDRRRFRIGGPAEPTKSDPALSELQRKNRELRDDLMLAQKKIRQHHDLWHELNDKLREQEAKIFDLEGQIARFKTWWAGLRRKPIPSPFEEAAQ